MATVSSGGESGKGWIFAIVRNAKVARGLFFAPNLVSCLLGISSEKVISVGNIAIYGFTPPRGYLISSI
jgi:hypothetical protein